MEGFIQGLQPVEYMSLVDADPGAIAFSAILKDFATGRLDRKTYIFIRDGNGVAVNGILVSASVASKLMKW